MITYADIENTKIRENTDVFIMRLDDYRKEQLREIAKKNKTTMSGIIKKLIDVFLENNK